MKAKTKGWKVRDKARLLSAMMEELEGEAHISFEGDLRALALTSYPGASQQPTDVLKRGTVWPKQDFIVIPLAPSVGKQIIAALGGTVPATVLHIQIEKRGVLEFGAYDNFHPECIFFGTAVSQATVESLLASEIIQPL
jgi:hypothetical protein